MDYHQTTADMLNFWFWPMLIAIPEWHWLQDIGRMDSLPNIAGC